MKIIFIIALCFSNLLSVLNTTKISLKEVRDVFEQDLCLQASLDTLHLKNRKTEEGTNLEGILDLATVGRVEVSEKPVLSKLNELAHFHDIDYYFTLIKDEGPPHQRLFTVSLNLGKETFFGQGTSHKRAKEDAARKALEQTVYEAPPTKETTTKDIQKLTPTVVLNNIGSKLGVDVTYFLIDKDKVEILHSNVVLTEKNQSYLKKLNHSIYLDKNLKMKRDIDSTKGPFHIKLKFGDYTFHSTSHSIQSGRHEVASIALDFLSKNRDQLNFACLKEGYEKECKMNRNELKSPISKIYEEAQQRKLSIEFEQIAESGPSHKRNFITECRLGDIKTTGEGSSKKESKRMAAINMLEKIKEMDPLPLEMSVQSYDGDKKKKRKKKNKLIKTKLDEISMALDNAGKSVIGFAKNILGEDNKDTESLDKLEKGNKKSDLKQKRDSKQDDGELSSEEELLELGNVLNFKVVFTDLNEDSKYFSLLSLYTNPEYTCFGEGKTEFLARNIAAKHGLDLLSKMGIYDIFLESKGDLLERQIKEEMRVYIDHTILKDKEEL